MAGEHIIAVAVVNLYVLLAGSISGHLSRSMRYIKRLHMAIVAEEWKRQQRDRRGAAEAGSVSWRTKSMIVEHETIKISYPSFAQAGEEPEWKEEDEEVVEDG